MLENNGRFSIQRFAVLQKGYKFIFSLGLFFVAKNNERFLAFLGICSVAVSTNNGWFGFARSRGFFYVISNNFLQMLLFGFASFNAFCFCFGGLCMSTGAFLCMMSNFFFDFIVFLIITFLQFQDFGFNNFLFFLLFQDFWIR